MPADLTPSISFSLSPVPPRTPPDALALAVFRAVADVDVAEPLALSVLDVERENALWRELAYSAINLSHNQHRGAVRSHTRIAHLIDELRALRVPQ